MKIPELSLKVKTQILIWVILLISVLIYFAGKQIPEESLRNFISQFGPLGPVIFIFLSLIPYILAPINGIPFLIAGYYLFGVNVIFFQYPTALMGFALNFYISRRWGRPFLSKFLDEKALKKIDSIIKNHGILTLIAFRIFQGGLGDYVSYAFGLTKISFKKYFLASALAIIPGQIIWYYFASKTDNIEGFLAVNWLLAALFVSILFASIFIFGKVKKK